MKGYKKIELLEWSRDPVQEQSNEKPLKIPQYWRIDSTMINRHNRKVFYEYLSLQTYHTYLYNLQGCTPVSCHDNVTFSSP